MNKQELREYVNERYKEISNNNGDTKPSHIVNYILQELTNKGYRVYLHESYPVPVKGISVDGEGVIYHV